MMNDPVSIRELYLQNLNRSLSQHRPSRWKDWTKLAAEALLCTGQELAQLSEHEIDWACRGLPSSHGRSEHLSLDVVVYGRCLGPILFAAEHENTVDGIHIWEYQCWKLLHVHALNRILVGYFSSAECPTVAVQRLQAVARKNRGRDLLFLLAPAKVRDTTRLDADVYALHSIGA